MPRIGPVTVTNVAIPRKISDARSAQFTVTLPSNPPGPWTAKAITTQGVEIPAATARLTTGTRQLVVVVENHGLSDHTIASIAVDH